MRVLQSKSFSRFARRSGIRPVDLLDAVERAGSGLIDADLGGGLVKLRIAKTGSGKSGGFRTLLVFRSGDRAIFVYGFAKSSLANIGEQELRDLRLLSKLMLSYSHSELDQAVADEILSEVSDAS